MKERIVHGGDCSSCKLITLATFLSGTIGYLCRIFFNKSILVVIRGEKDILNFKEKMNCYFAYIYFNNKIILGFEQ